MLVRHESEGHAGLDVQNVSKTKSSYLMLLILFACILTACHKQTVDRYTVTKNNVVYTVDTINQTITGNKYVYEYKIQGNQYTITYPDGASFIWTQDENTGYGGASLDMSTDDVILGTTLAEILREGPAGAFGKSTHTSVKNIWFILILGAIGIGNVSSPKTGWYLRYGWKYKNAEPSDDAILFQRIGGIICLIIAVIYIFI